MKTRDTSLRGCTRDGRCAQFLVGASRAGRGKRAIEGGWSAMPTRGIALSLSFVFGERLMSRLPPNWQFSLFGFGRSFDDNFAFLRLKTCRKSNSFARSQSKMQTIWKMMNAVLPPKKERSFLGFCFKCENCHVFVMIFMFPSSCLHPFLKM